MKRAERDPRRARARQLADESLRSGQPVEWFDTLYCEANAEAAVVPWDDRVPNPHLIEWLDETPGDGRGKSALDLGCGYGENAAELARRGYLVSACDVSPTALETARRRHPKTPVAWHALDAAHPPSHWRGAFDLVTEIYTLQVLPPSKRDALYEVLPWLVRRGGTLLVVARGRDTHEPPGEMPWPLTVPELVSLGSPGFELIDFSDFEDEERPPVRRFRAVYRRF